MYRLTLLTLLVTVYAGILTAQNTFHNVLGADAGARVVVISNPGPLQANDPILLYQAAGADPILSGAQTGRVANLNGAGRYNVNTVSRRSGDSLFLRLPFPDGFDPAFTQLVAAPPATDLVAQAADYPAVPYDPVTRRGGVIFVTAQNTLTVADTFDASGLGFRGGTGEEANSQCSRFTAASEFTYPAGNWRGSRRGRGVTTLAAGRELGRAPSGNGGGGANDHNAGGGGGGNVAAGGLGGINVVFGIFNFACRGNFPGLPGQALPAEDDRAYLGGGGGAGHANNTDAAAGADGGGLVVLWAPRVEFALESGVRANGQAAPLVTGDGGGGGGAAGSLVLLADTLVGSPLIELRGGGGADVDNPSDRCFGPGGGGGGGRILNAARVTANYSPTLILAGGDFGRRLNSNTCDPDDDPPGAGATGTEEFIAAPLLVAGFDLSATDICAGDTLQLTDRSSGADSTEFSVTPFTAGITLASSGNDRRVIVKDTVSGTFKLLQTLRLGTSAIAGDTIQFTVNATATVDTFLITPDPDRSDCFTFSLPGARGFSNVTYSFGDGEVLTTTDTVVTYCYAAGGSYLPSARLENAICGEVTLAAPAINLGEFSEAMIDIKNPAGCAPFTLTLSQRSRGAFTGVRWDAPGADPAISDTLGPVVTYATPGTYLATLTLQNGIGPDTVDQIEIRVFDVPTAGFTTSVDTSRLTLTYAPIDTFDYRWNFGDATVVDGQATGHDYTAPGNYVVTQLVTNGPCSAVDTQTVVIDVLSGTRTLTELGIQVYPNPTSGLLHLRGEARIIRVLDEFGRVSTRARIGAAGRSVDLAGLPSGRYLIGVSAAGQLYWAKVVKGG